MNVQLNDPHWIAMQAGVLSIVEGHPGWAKTATHTAFVEALAAAQPDCDWRFEGMMLNDMSPEDFGGIPVPTKVNIAGVERECVRNLLDERMERAKHEHVVIFFDEPNTASPQTLAAAQEWMNAPPANCLMGGAMNPIETATAGSPLPPAVLNRACVTTWHSDNDARISGFASAGRDWGKAKFPIVPRDFRDHYCDKWGVLVNEFIAHTGNEHYNEDHVPDYDNPQSWPTQRSWFNFILCLGAAESVGASKTTQSRLGKGTIGHGAAMAFLAWLDQRDLPDPRKILANPSSLRLPNRFDLAAAIIKGVVGEVKRVGDGATWEQGIDVLCEVFEQNREVALAAHGQFWNVKPKGHEPNRRVGTWDEIVEMTTGHSKRNGVPA